MSEAEQQAPIEKADTRAHYTAQLVASGTVIAVTDHNDGDRSVTNDAESVVRQVGEMFGGLRGKRIIYRDSMHVWDELQHDGRAFKAFRSLGARTLWDAVAALGAS